MVRKVGLPVYLDALAISPAIRSIWCGKTRASLNSFDIVMDGTRSQQRNTETASGEFFVPSSLARSAT